MEIFEPLTLRQKRFQQIIGAFLIIGGLICIYQPEYHFIKTLLRYTPQIALGYWLLGLAFLALKQSRLTMVSFVCCGFLCLFLKGVSNSTIEPLKQTNSSSVRVGQMNLAASNSKQSKVLEAIKKSETDVISLQEVSLSWSKILQDSLADLYPYNCHIQSADLYGIELFSKYPFMSCDTFYSGGTPNLLIGLKKEYKGELTYIMSTYIAPPLFSSAYQMMRKQMLVIAEHVRQIHYPVIVLGDYNIEGSSREIQQFRDEAGLISSRRGFKPSSKDGSFNLMEVATDYIFSTPQLECIHFETMTDTNKEHLGIIGTFQLTNDSVNVTKDSVNVTKAN